MTYWQSKAWVKQKLIEQTREKLASDKATQTKPPIVWNPQFPEGINRMGWEASPPPTFADKYKQGAGKVAEFLTGRPSGWMPRTPGEVFGTVGTSALMAAPGVGIPAKAVGIGGKALAVAGAIDVATNPLAWIKPAARAIGGIGRKVLPTAPLAVKIEQTARVERLAQETGLVEGQDWAKFYDFVEEVIGRKVRKTTLPTKAPKPTVSQPAGVKEAIPTEIERLTTKYNNLVSWADQLKSEGFKGGKLIQAQRQVKIAKAELDRATAVPVAQQAEKVAPAGEVKTPSVQKILNSLNPEEVNKVIDALGGDKPIVLPSAGGKTPLGTIIKEVSSSAGGARKPPKGIVSEASLAKTWYERASEKVRETTLKFDRMNRIVGAMDKGDYNGKFSQVYMHSTQDAMDNKILGVLNWQGKYQALRAATKLKLSDKTPIGNTVITSSERIGVYLNSRNPDNLRHMMRGNQYTEAQVNEVIASLTPQEKVFADFYEKWAQDVYPRLAAAYKYATGKELPKTEGYWPILVELEEALLTPKQKPAGMDDFTYLLQKEAELRGQKRWPTEEIAKAMTKARKKGASQALTLDADEVFYQRMIDTEHYIAMSPTMTDLQKIHSELSPAIVYRFGKPVYDEIGTWLTDVAATRPHQQGVPLEGLYRFLRVNASSSAIGLNPLSVMRQPLALFIAMPEIGSLPILHGLTQTIKNPKAVAQTAMAMSPTLRNRLNVGYIAEAKVFEAVAKRMGKVGRMQAKVQNVSMLAATTLDRYTTLATWQGALYRSQKIGMAEKDAIRYADDILRRTQAMFSVTDMPSAYRRGSELTKGLLVFTNQINQNWNYWKYDIVNMWGEGKINAPEALGKYIEAFAIAALLEGWITRSTIPDSPKDVGMDLLKYNVGTIPIIGGIATEAIEYGQMSPSSITASPIESASKVWSGKTFGKKAEGTVEMVAQLAGLPLAQPKRTIKASVDMIQGKTDDWLSLIWGTWRREKEEREKLRQQGFTSDSGDDSFFVP